MTEQVQDSVHVVTAGGAGVGRFLAATLLEALQVGGDVVVRASPTLPAGGASGFDFVFRRPELAEVIRVGVDIDHRVVSAELFRGRTPGGGAWSHSVWPDGLLRALGAGESVAELKWRRTAEDRDGLEVVVRRDCCFSVSLLR